MTFTPIDNAVAIIGRQGVHRAVKVYERKGYIYVAYGGGYCYVAKSGLGAMGVHLVEIELPFEPRHGALGKFMVPEGWQPFEVTESPKKDK